MKVTVLFPYKLNPFGVNAGAANATLSLTRALLQCGHLVTVYYPCEVGKTPETAHETFVEYDGVRRISIDTDLFITVLVDNRLSELRRFRVTHETLRAVFYHNALFNTGDRQLMHFFRTWPDFFFIVSRHSALHADSLRIKNCYVVPNGVSLDLERTANPARKERDTLLFVFVGALVRAKGVDRLVRAFAKFGQDHEGVQLKVVGSSKLWFQPQADFELVSDKSIQYLGEVNTAEVHQLCSEASFIVLPSEMEASPLSIIDGMFLGCIPIVTPVGGLSELVTDGVSGLIISESSVQGILVALERALALTSEERASLSNRAAAEVSSRTWKSAALLVAGLCMNRPRRRRWLPFL